MATNKNRMLIQLGICNTGMKLLETVGHAYENNMAL